jgi:rhodanese-related sulfurtransferase
LSLVACSEPTAAQAPGANATRQLDARGLAAEQAAGKVTLLLDVRTEGEFSSGHVPGAINLPLDRLRADAPELAGKAGGEVHVICQSGGRSMTASGQLAGWGFQPVNIQGGTSSWRAAGLPVE